MYKHTHFSLSSSLHFIFSTNMFYGVQVIYMTFTLLSSGFCVNRIASL
uniref:Uncharacterized protein n=1 Tax=Anguilla anguilla TaxID=7936 RepID=A0A0E9W0X2_ANGAN